MSIPSWDGIDKLLGRSAGIAGVTEFAGPKSEPAQGAQKVDVPALAEAVRRGSGSWEAFAETVFGDAPGWMENKRVERSVEEAREAVVRAQIAHDRRARVGLAEQDRRRFAEARVQPRLEDLQEGAVRLGWSQEQLVSRMRNLANEISSSQPVKSRGGGEPSRRPDRESAAAGRTIVQESGRLWVLK